MVVRRVDAHLHVTAARDVVEREQGPAVALKPISTYEPVGVTMTFDLSMFHMVFAR